jgi:hypothetical protein
MTLAYTDSTSWVTTGTLVTGQGSYKQVTDASAAAGDLLVMLGAAENYDFSGGIRAASTQAGSTGSWTVVGPSPTLDNDTEVCAAYATVSSTGSFTGRLQIKTNSADHMGVALVRIPAADYNASGTIITASGAADTDGQISITLTTGTYTVIYLGADWTASAPGSTNTPSGGTNRATVTDSGLYSIAIRTWTGQAAGTRNYGPSGLSSKDYTGIVIAIPEASSGTGYTASPSDAEGLTDSAVSVIAVVRSASDALGLTDNPTASVGFSRTLDDSLGLADNPTFTVDYSRAPDDALGLTDSAAAVVDHVRVISDSLGLVDSTSTALAAGRAVADSAGLTDYVLTEIVEREGAFDPVFLADDIATVMTAARSASDALGLTDSVTVTLGGAGSAFDNLGLTDAVVTTLTIVRSASDALGLTDSASGTIAGAGDLQLDDPLGLLDAASSVIAASRAALDNLGLTDAVVAHLVSGETPTTPDGRHSIVRASRVLLLIPLSAARTATVAGRTLVLTRVEDHMDSPIKRGDTAVLSFTLDPAPPAGAAVRMLLRSVTRTVPAPAPIDGSLSGSTVTVELTSEHTANAGIFEYEVEAALGGQVWTYPNDGYLRLDIQPDLG